MFEDPIAADSDPVKPSETAFCCILVSYSSRRPHDSPWLDRKTVKPAPRSEMLWSSGVASEWKSGVEGCRTNVSSSSSRQLASWV